MTNKNTACISQTCNDPGRIHAIYEEMVTNSIIRTLSRAPLNSFWHRSTPTNDYYSISSFSITSNSGKIQELKSVPPPSFTPSITLIPPSPYTKWQLAYHFISFLFLSPQTSKRSSSLQHLANPT